MKKHYDVVAAIFIDEQKRIFCAQRKNKGELALKWEFPGGKIEKGELPEDALKREIIEELNILSSDFKPFMTVFHTYLTFDITLQSFICKGSFNELELNDHENVKWVKINDLLTLDWADADLPIVKKIIEVYQ